IIGVTILDIKKPSLELKSPEEKSKIPEKLLFKPPSERYQFVIASFGMGASLYLLINVYLYPVNPINNIFTVVLIGIFIFLILFTENMTEKRLGKILQFVSPLLLVGFIPFLLTGLVPYAPDGFMLFLHSIFWPCLIYIVIRNLEPRQSGFFFAIMFFLSMTVLTVAFTLTTEHGFTISAFRGLGPLFNCIAVALSFIGILVIIKNEHK
ncbi:MAG: hypothetical protein ACTSWY_00805, partial [Promethearchaeota archaeon]